jgi:hypothetical protein
LIDKCADVFANFQDPDVGETEMMNFEFTGAPSITDKRSINTGVRGS